MQSIKRVNKESRTGPHVGEMRLEIRGNERLKKSKEIIKTKNKSNQKYKVFFEFSDDRNGGVFVILF